MDYDQFLDNAAFSDLGYDPNYNPADGNDFNIDLDGTADFAAPPHSGGTGTAADGGTAGHFEAGNVDATDTPSPAGTEEITRTDLDTPERKAKRRRQG